jgi:hypothetical protein
MNMQCDQFERILEELDSGPLPKQALAHMDVCEACRSLNADFGAILGVALELGAEDLPVPEHVWLSLSSRLESEGLIHQRLVAGQTMGGGWWTIFQRPAMAGAFLSLTLAAAVLIVYQSDSQQLAVYSQLAPHQVKSPVLFAENMFKEEAKNVGAELIPGLEKRDAAVADSLRRNLGIVDNFIAMCEKNVHEQPDNQMAQEYLYGAYEQKAELLATAMNRSVTGGLQ